MLDHEDHGMMATFMVVKPGAAASATPLVRQGLSGSSLTAITSVALCRRKETL
jgi:hypothetical protein